MTRAEVIDLVMVMVARWPHQRALDSDASIADYAEVLAVIEHDHARAALESWHRDGERWAPNAAQLLRRVAELAIDVPDFGQVKAAILGWGAPDVADVEPLVEACPHGACDGDGMVVDVDANTTYRCACWQDRLARKRARRARHPLVAEFLRHMDPREFTDLAGDRIAEAQLRAKWEAFVRGVVREITYQGIDPAGLPALERITAAPAERARLQSRRTSHKGLRSPDMLRLVGGGGA